MWKLGMVTYMENRFCKWHSSLSPSLQTFPLSARASVLNVGKDMGCFQSLNCRDRTSSIADGLWYSPVFISIGYTQGFHQR